MKGEKKIIKAFYTWKEKLQFVSEMGVHSVAMDAKRPLGTETAATPKELVLSALCGCTAMDVVALLKKYKQPLEEFHIEASAKTRAIHPAVFSEILLIYKVKGALDRQKVVEAVRLSESQYCSVSAMLSRVVKVRYIIEINGEEVDRGLAGFEDHIAEPDQS